MLLFVLGLAWLCSLSSVCVTTGELKPRGVFLAEYSLTPSFATSRFETSDFKVPAMFPGLLELGVDHRMGRLSQLKGGLLLAPVASDRREALCVVTRENHGDDLAWNLARHLSKQKWLSKNVFFLILPQDESYTAPNNTLKLWLDAYANDPMDDRLARSGTLRTAIIIDYPSELASVSPYERVFGKQVILTQGRDGRLPNMDLINTVVHLAIPSLPQTFFHDDALVKPSDQLLSQGIAYAVQTLLAPNGFHQEFLKLGIDALTLNLTRGPLTGNLVSQGMKLEVVQHLEKTIRSLSNMGERFNRGFFFYIMLGRHHFVSNDEYLWAALLLLSPLIVEPFYVSLAPSWKNSAFQYWWNALISVGIAIILGGVALPLLLRQEKDKLGLSSPSSSPSLSLLIGWILLVVGFTTWERKTLTKQATPAPAENLEYWQYRKAANESFLFIAVSCVALVHFPLGLACAVCTFPSTRLTVPAARSRLNPHLALGLYGLLFLCTSLPVFLQDYISFADFEDLRAIMFFWVVIPNQLLNASLLFLA